MTENRGIRLNNPTNIKRVPGQTWVGQTPKQSDPVFVEFTEPKYCYRASTRIIMGHYVANTTTTADVCMHWAPPNENDTKKYIAAVTKRTGFNGPLDLPAQLPALLHALTVQEEGACPYDDQVIVDGIELDGVQLVTQPVEAPPPRQDSVAAVIAAMDEPIVAHEPVAHDEPPAAMPRPPDPLPPLAMHILRSSMVRGVLIIAVGHALAYFKISSSLLGQLGLPSDTGTIVDAAVDWACIYGGATYIAIARYLQKAAPTLVFTKAQAAKISAPLSTTQEMTT